MNKPPFNPSIPSLAQSQVVTVAMTAGFLIGEESEK